MCSTRRTCPPLAVPPLPLLQLPLSYWTAGEPWLGSLLHHFPALTALSLPQGAVSLADAQGLASAACAATLRSLHLPEPRWASAESVNEGVQLMGDLPALQELDLRLVSHASPGHLQQQSEAAQGDTAGTAAAMATFAGTAVGAAAGSEPAVDFSPLGALSQLQRLCLSLTMACNLDASSLCAVATGCSELSHLSLQLQGVHVQGPAAGVPGAGEQAEEVEQGREEQEEEAEEGEGEEVDAAGGQPAGAAVAATGAWPSLKEVSFSGLQPQALSSLLAAAFHSCPNLHTTSLDLHLKPGYASSAAALRALCDRLSALTPGQLEEDVHISLLWPAAEGLRSQLEHVPRMFASLAPMRYRVCRLHVTDAVISAGDVAALAAAVGHGLKELDMCGCSGPAGAVAVEAVTGFTDLRRLLLPRPDQLSDWEDMGDKIMLACGLAQTSAQRIATLTMVLPAVLGDTMSKLQQAWEEEQAGLGEGPDRVVLQQGKCAKGAVGGGARVLCVRGCGCAACMSSLP